MEKKVKAIVKVLKARFNNLSAEELVDLAFKILVAIDESTNGNRSVD